MKPLLFIPGYPGSELHDNWDSRKLFFRLGILDQPRTVERLQGPDDPDFDDGIMATRPIPRLIHVDLGGIVEFDLGKQAQSLYDLLRRELGYHPFTDAFRPFGWDWRKSVHQQGMLTALEGAIKDLVDRNGGARVVVIVHSTGGLVLRALLEDWQRHPGVAACLERIVAIGVPWAGLLGSLRAMDGQKAFPCLSEAETVAITGRSHAAFDLCPADPARTDMTDREGQPLDVFVGGGGQGSPLRDTAWIERRASDVPPKNAALQAAMLARAALSDAAHGARSRTIAFEPGAPSPAFTNIVGWGFPTLVRCEVVPAGAKVRLVFNEIRGAAALAESVREGDGTVPRRSADWIQGAETFYVPVGHYPGQQITQKHNQLWRLPSTQRLLIDLLSDRSPGPFVHAAADGDDAVSVRPGVRVRLTAQDGSGAALPGATARFRHLLPADDTLHPVGADGRLVHTVARSSIRQQVGHGLLRFQVTVDWQGAAEPITRTLIVQRTT